MNRRMSGASTELAISSDDTGRSMLARMIGELPDAVVVVDFYCNVKWANRSAERLFDRSLADCIGMSGIDLVHPEDLELVLRSFVSVQNKEVGTAIEVRVSAATGWRLVEVLGAPVTWFDEKAALLCLRDVTERRRFEVARGHEARLRSIVSNSAAVTMLVTRSGTVESASGALTRLLGYDPELVEHQPIEDLVEPSARPELLRALECAELGASATSPVTVEVPLLRHSGAGVVPFELVIVNLLDDPTVGGFVVSAHDITARSVAEQSLRSTLSLLTATLDSTADGILVVDADGRVTRFNRRLIEMWKLPEHLVDHGKSTDPRGDNAAVVAFVLDQLADPESFAAKLEEVNSQPDSESDDVLEFKDGRVFEWQSKPQRVEGEVVGRVWSFHDVTDRKRLEAELSYQAFHDPLTGLANKALFSDRLQHAAARIERNNGHLAVLFIDLDDFKTVNDSLGHAAGDELLRRVAEIVVGCVRKVDTAARLGGDEFAVLVEDVIDRDNVRNLADRILAASRIPVSVGNEKVATTVSIGITFDSQGATCDQLLRNADLAMYTAKERGKNRFEEFESEMHATVVARLEAQAHLTQALAGRQLTVYYQPVVDLYTDSIVGFEALARWRHPTRGLLAPASFIPFAEESDLITEIDSFVMREACAQLRCWQLEQDESLVMSVNASSRRLVDRTLKDDVEEVLQKSGLSPSSLVLEVTESAVMRDTEAAARNLDALKTLGVRIALDDFGTGYSSLAHLEALPIDILKIDKSFVSTVDPLHSGSGLASAIVQLAHTLGHTPVAEGVERPDQVMHLRRLGCRLAQGYHLGIPKDAVAAGATLRSRCDRSRRAIL
jgi:diguanylate cyclase (GGDEF)-like protein/PAS domain S-box-containing protein